MAAPGLRVKPASSGGGPMCFNCGCRMSSESHGDPNNITDKHFEQAAKAAGESTEEAMRNTLDLLKEKLSER